MIGFCGWATFREPWNMESRWADWRARRRWAYAGTPPRSGGTDGLDIELQPESVSAVSDLDRSQPDREAVTHLAIDRLDVEVLRSTSGDVCVDLSGVPLLTERAFGDLIAAKRFLVADKRRLVLCGVSVLRRQTLELAQLGDSISTAA